MSYCRFSSENYHCDIYCYAHVNGGFVTDVTDGRSFFDDSAAQCADRLELLRQEGLRVPQYAIDSLRSEESHA